MGNLDDKKHRNFLDLAFQLAEVNLGQTGTNPSVGSLIVKNNSVLSSGVTSVMVDLTLNITL